MSLKHLQTCALLHADDDYKSGMTVASCNTSRINYGTLLRINLTGAHVASDTASNTDDDDAHDDKDDKDDDDGDDNSSDDDDDDDKGDDGDDDIFDLCGEQTGSLVIHAPAGRAE